MCRSTDLDNIYAHPLPWLPIMDVGDQEGEQPLGIQHWCGDKTRISWTVLHDNNARVPASAAVFLSNGRLLQREGKQGW